MGQDLVGGLRPDERVAALVPAVDEGPDRSDELTDAGVGAAPDGLPGDEAEEDLDEVEFGLIEILVIIILILVILSFLGYGVRR